MNIQRYNKAIVVVLGALLIPVLAQVGITLDTTIEQALGLVVTAALVWFVPNRK